jgi:hypothetical protein
MDFFSDNNNIDTNFDNLDNINFDNRDLDNLNVCDFDNMDNLNVVNDVNDVNDVDNDDIDDNNKLDLHLKNAFEGVSFKVEPPFPNFPNIESCQSKRMTTLGQWLEQAQIPEGGFKWLEQSQEPGSPITLPTLVQFTLACPYQEEGERGTPIICVLLAVTKEKKKETYYLLFYEGCHFLNHTANLGRDGKIYPWSSVNGAGHAMHGSNANSIDRFMLLDKGSYYVGKSLKALRDGPGFENTIDNNLLEEWGKIGKKTCSNLANYGMELVKAMEKERERGAEPPFKTPNPDGGAKGESTFIDEQDECIETPIEVVEDKVIKAKKAKLPAKTPKLSSVTPTKKRAPPTEVIPPSSVTTMKKHKPLPPPPQAKEPEPAQVVKKRKEPPLPQQQPLEQSKIKKSCIDNISLVEDNMNKVTKVTKVTKVVTTMRKKTVHFEKGEVPDEKEVLNAQRLAYYSTMNLEQLVAEREALLRRKGHEAPL